MPIAQIVICAYLLGQAAWVIVRAFRAIARREPYRIRLFRAHEVSPRVMLAVGVVGLLAAIGLGVRNFVIYRALESFHYRAPRSWVDCSNAAALLPACATLPNEERDKISSGKWRFAAVQPDGDSFSGLVSGATALERIELDDAGFDRVLALLGAANLPQGRVLSKERETIHGVAVGHLVVEARPPAGALLHLHIYVLPRAFATGVEVFTQTVPRDDAEADARGEAVEATLTASGL